MKMKSGITAILTAITLASAIFIGELPAAGAAFAAEAGTKNQIGLSETIETVYETFAGFGMDFFNIDFAGLELDYDNAHIIQAAKHFIPTELSDDYSEEVIDANDLKLFMEEAFGIDLPFESIDMYTYNEKDNTFSWPASDAGYKASSVKASDFIINEDGSVTMKAEIYSIGMPYYDWDAYETSLKKPVAEWDKRITYGKTVSSEIRFTVNTDFAFFPVKLIEIKSELFDWNQAQGTYEAEDGNLTFSFRIDDRYSERNLSILITEAESGAEYEMTGYITGNCAVLHTQDLILDFFMTLDSAGSFVVSAESIPELGFDPAGSYMKVSDELPPLGFYKGYDTFNATGIDREDAPNEPNYLGYYNVPFISGLGDEKFEAAINKQIADEIVETVRIFENEYNELRADISNESNPDAKKNLTELSERYAYQSDLYTVTKSINYYAIAVPRYEYTGGAHPSFSLRIYNIGVPQKKLLSLSDILKDESCIQDIEEMLAEKSKTDDYKDLLYESTKEVKITDESNFYLASEKLVIFYQPYEIGPFASSFIVFEIPFEDLEGLLKKEYYEAGYRTEVDEEWLFSSVFEFQVQLR